MQAGVEVVATRYNGTIHDFMTLNAMADAAPTRRDVASRAFLSFIMVLFDSRATDILRE